MDVLILGNHTQGLGILRSLCDSGLSIHMLNDSKFSVAKFSRYLTKYHLIKDGAFRNLHTKEGHDYFIDILLGLASSSSKTVLFCTDEDIVNAVYLKREALKEFYYIPKNNILSIVDKLLFARRIEEIGLPTPKTFSLQAIDSKILPISLEYICKGRIGSKYKITMHQKATPIKTDKLDEFIQSLCGHIDLNEVIIQEKISVNHKVISCCGLAVDGHIKREFQYLKVRQYPITFGTGTYLKSIHQKTVSEYSLQIIEKFKYTGIFEIEFLVNDNDDTIIVLEMNPRTWKSIDFSSNCNQNLVLAYTDFLLKGSMPLVDLTYSKNVYWAHITADFLASIALHKAPCYYKGTFFAVNSKEDLLPFILELLTFPLLYWSRIKAIFTR